MMQKSAMIKSRDRFSKAENRRIQTFDDITIRESSQFERVKKEATVLHNEILNLEMKNALHRANSASERERGRRRDRERVRDRVERARDKRRDREKR